MSDDIRTAIAKAIHDIDCLAINADQCPGPGLLDQLRADAALAVLYQHAGSPA